MRWLALSAATFLLLPATASAQRVEDAYFNSEAGWCQADAATANFMDAAVKKGVKRVTADVSELVYEDGRISGVRTSDGQHIKADKVLLAAGAWTSHLLSPVEDTLKIPENNRIERQVTAVGQISAYYTVSDAEGKELFRAARYYGFRNIQNLVRKLKPAKQSRMPGAIPKPNTQERDTLA